MNELGTFIKVWELDDFCFCIVESDLEKLDQALTSYLVTKTDQLVNFTLRAGDEYTVRISAIKSWRISTPAGRKNEMLNGDLQKKEDKEFQAELGIFSED